MASLEDSEQLPSLDEIQAWSKIKMQDFLIDQGYPKSGNKPVS